MLKLMKKYQILTMLLVLAIVLILPFSVSAKTKAGTKPGSFFYFFDKAFEKADLFFTFSPEKKAKKALENTEERLAEVEELKNENNQEAATEAMENYQKNIEVLEKVLNKVPEEAKEAIEKAIETSKERQEEAMKETAELEKEVSEIEPEVEEAENELKEKENKEKAEIKDDKKDEQSKEIEKLKKEVEGLKQRQPQVKIIEKIVEKENPITIEKKESSSSQTKQNENIITLPNGAVVEMDGNGNVVKTIKEAEAAPQVTTFKHVIVNAPQYVSREIKKGETNVPFISLRLQSGGDAPVRVESVNIRIIGPANAIKIMKIANCNIPQMLNDKSEATLVCPLSIKNGSSNNYNIIADISDDISSENGKTIQVSVESIKAEEAVISGEFPILSAPHKIIAPPVIVLPKATVIPGKVDYQPNKTTGTKDYVFSSIKITSDKTVFLNSIKWNMSGSGGPGSFENLKTYLNDIPHNIESSSDGKYFISNFNRAVIGENETKEVYIKGNIVDSGDHTLDFDIYKNIDLVITDESGNTIIAKPEQIWNYENSGGFRSGNPWYDGYRVRVAQ